MRPRSQDQHLTTAMMMFDAQITVVLFAAFLLAMIAGSGIEAIARGGTRSVL